MTLPDRFVRLFNAHDADAFADCFTSAYRSEHPVHPARGFGGRAQVRENWSLVFHDVPDVRMELLRSVVAEGVWWMECRISGTRKDGSKLELRGVALNGLDGDRIAWGRLYLEETDRSHEDIRAAVHRWARHLGA